MTGEATSPWVHGSRPSAALCHHQPNPEAERAPRAGPTDLAALAVGAAAYITVFIGLMGVVLALFASVALAQKVTDPAPLQFREWWPGVATVYRIR